ncbi:MAG: hypothetical protein ABW328_00660 [Ilumatobacteraceae bacterium]
MSQPQSTPSAPALRVGCAMWAYKAWQGLHFPDHLARREQLGVCTSWCNAVEGNTTFYGFRPDAPEVHP